MAKKAVKKVEEIEVNEAKTVSKPAIKLKTFVLKRDYSPKKKGDRIQLNAEAERIFKQQNLI